ncbi:MAG: hypothetical protein OJF59_002801 [Cytophagales bacterium]|nr:MAG: hypothetical protein OJF59_002801 [Cytophagales bacterium]
MIGRANFPLCITTEKYSGKDAYTEKSPNHFFNRLANL